MGEQKEDTRMWIQCICPSHLNVVKDFRIATMDPMTEIAFPQVSVHKYCDSCFIYDLLIHNVVM